MKGENLVTRQEHSMRCEIHTCNETVDFSIGLEGFRPAYLNVCEECLREIVKQGYALLEMTPDDLVIEVETVNETEQPQQQEQPVDTNTPPTDEKPSESEEKAITEPPIEQAQPEPQRKATENVEPEQVQEEASQQEHPGEEEPQEPIEQAQPEEVTAQDEPQREEVVEPTLPEQATKAEEEFYVCKYCGEKFAKPLEKMKYVGHVKECKKAHGE